MVIAAVTGTVTDRRLREAAMDRMTPAPQGFRPVPRTGVIFVMTEAARLGYQRGSTEWSNLGQGAPETGELPDAPARLTRVDIDEDDHEYAPIDGLPELRQAVAELYNERYRGGKRSRYTKENVAICSGGRLAITRLASTLGKGHVGHFLPDYTAYEELLEAFHTFSPIPMLRLPERDYCFSADELRNEVLGRGLSAVLLSNPCNPTGTLVSGAELGRWVQTARELECTLIVDEFYAHYLYDNGAAVPCGVSAAEFVEDVDVDPVVICDGLTKNWRYPGFRVSWTLGPRGVIESLASAGSFLDGGCARPMQRAALQLVDRATADSEARAIQQAFGKKRRMMIDRLRALGVVIQPEPRGGFYCWGDVSGLPASLRTGMLFFRRALEVGVIVVPGVFFDINPGKRRPDRASRFGSYVRFSFGPSEEEVDRGLSRLESMVRDAQREGA